ncbi:MAG: hypothetical protein ABFC38_06255 [Methanospirillum sp.]
MNRSRSKQWQTINATRYEGDATSGDVLTFATNFFPGENYYIAYYGIMGPADLSEETIHRIHRLAMTSLPRFGTIGWYAFDPATPMTLPPPPLIPMAWLNRLAFLGLIAFLIVGVVFLPALILAFITATIAFWMGARLAPRIRAVLPPLVAACLIVASVLLDPISGRTAGVWIASAALVALISMAVLTPWPLFRERGKVVKPRTAVFVCGVGTFFVVLFGIVPWTLFPPDPAALMLSRPIVLVPSGAFRDRLSREHGSRHGILFGDPALEPDPKTPTEPRDHGE